MYSLHVRFVVPAAQRAQVSRAVAAEARELNPFRLQQVVFDTSEGACVERGLYLVVASQADGGRVQRVIQPLNAWSSRQVEWPDSGRLFDAARFQDFLVASSEQTAPDVFEARAGGALLAPGFGPPFEEVPFLLPRGRIVSRGRQGLLDAPAGPQGKARVASVEVVFERAELRTATASEQVFMLSFFGASAASPELFAVARQWQQRFGLALDAGAPFMRAARLGAGQQAHAKHFSAPVWLPGRTMPETANYPAVNESTLLAAKVSDLSLGACAIAAGEAHDSRLQGFEDAVHAVACLQVFSPRPEPGGRPEVLPEPLMSLRNRRLNAHILNWLESSLQSGADIAESPLTPLFLQSVRAVLPVQLAALATTPATRAWVLDLVSWAAQRHRVSLNADAPDADEQENCKRRIDACLAALLESARAAIDGDLSARGLLWERLSHFDEVLNLFGAMLSRRLMLRYRMAAQGALNPLIDWLAVSTLIPRLSEFLAQQKFASAGEAEQFCGRVLAHWRAELALLEPRLKTQSGRLAQAIESAESLPVPAMR